MDNEKTLFAKIEIPFYDLARDEYPQERLEWAKKRVLAMVSEKITALSETDTGIYFKTELVSWKNPDLCTMYVGARAHIAPVHVRPIVFQAPEEYRFLSSPRRCGWCDSLNPKEDVYHSGTCENCGGPL